MNLNLINLDCTQWSKTDWQDAYNEYCKHNLYGAKTKREYYDMVIANFKKIAPQPLSEELRNTWTNGWNKAVVWAKKRKCNMNGVLLENSHPKIDLESLQNDVKDLQWLATNKRI